jgi:16S rRNA (guanine527-N7)-methyltransferase
MDPVRIAELLTPFVAAPSLGREPVSLAESQVKQISMYIDILLRWNARMNLTAVRRPEDIVTRHFGESLFAARYLLPRKDAASPVPAEKQVGTAVLPSTSALPNPHPPYLLDVGSGAGFPGLPIKIWAPHILLTLIESSHKKATFLREVIRATTLTHVNVFCGRAQEFLSSAASEYPATRAAASPNPPADIVTLRAVEQFESILPIAASLVASAGRLALLVGESQVRAAYNVLPAFRWNDPVPIPLSTKRVLLVGTAEPR